MIIFLLSILLGSTAIADDQNWSQGTAHVLPRGRTEMGVFSPYRKGIKDGLELQLHPGWAIIAPHLAVKKDLLELARWNYAVRQSLSYPTQLLRLLARPGTGGIIAPDSQIPHIVSSDTRLLMTRNLGADHNLTIRFRAQLAAGFGEENWLTIDAPIAYTRTSAYHNGFASNVALRFDGKLFKGLGYVWDTNAWLLPGTDGHRAVEQFAYLTLKTKGSMAYQAGAVFVYGDYPYGPNWHRRTV